MLRPRSCSDSLLDLGSGPRGEIVDSECSWSDAASTVTGELRSLTAACRFSGDQFFWADCNEAEDTSSQSFLGGDSDAISVVSDASTADLTSDIDVTDNTSAWPNDSQTMCCIVPVMSASVATARRPAMPEWRTTLILRGVAGEALWEDVAELLNVAGFRGQYDFVYVPVNFKRLVAVGHAVLNFATAQSAEAALGGLQGAQLHGQTLILEWSESVQGVEALIKKYRNSSVMNVHVKVKHKPALFNAKGLRLSFPAPTEDLRHPLSWKGGKICQTTLVLSKLPPQFSQ